MGRKGSMVLSGPSIPVRRMLPVLQPALPVPPPKMMRQKSFSIMTYNVLAQCLVRRDFFPYASKEVLKIKYRFERLIKEITEIHRPDLACLQEVDRFETEYGAYFRKHDYDFVYLKKNPEKESGHGLCIIWNRKKFARHIYEPINFDGSPLTHPTPITPITNNIAQVLALKFVSSVTRIPTTPPSNTAAAVKPIAISPSNVNNPFGVLEDAGEGPVIPERQPPQEVEERIELENWGIIISNHHLYWKPEAQYEKLRQCYVVMKTVESMQKSIAAEQEKNRKWPVFVCGDFNSIPSEGVYKVLTKQSLTDELVKKLEPCEHQPVAPKRGKNGEAVVAEKDVVVDSEKEDVPKEVIPDPLPLPKLLSKFEQFPKLVSAYASYTQSHPEHAINPNWVNVNATTKPGEIKPVNNVKIKDLPTTEEKVTMQWNGEPTLTCYTQWKGTLDYIFAAEQPIPSSSNSSPSYVTFDKILEIPQPEVCEPGLPNKYFASDHLSLVADVSVWGENYEKEKR